MSEEICKDIEMNSLDALEKSFQSQNDDVFRINEDSEDPKEENESITDRKKANKINIVCGFVNKLVNKISMTSAITHKHKGSYKTGSQELLSLLERVIKGKSSMHNNLHSRPGVIGLNNHGNTCYINSVVQCLSNCQPLTNFMLSNKYKKSERFFTSLETSSCRSVIKDSFNKNSKFKAAKSKIHRQGSSSVIVDQFALLIKGVWYGRYSEEVSLKFKNQISKMEKQFRGGYQQVPLSLHSIQFHN